MRLAVAEGEAMDLAHGAASYPPASVRVASIAAMRAGTGAIIIAAGKGALPGGEDRMAVLQQSVGIIRDIGRQLQGYEGLVVIVTNPVDVLTVVFAESAGMAPHRVIGTGTMLDAARPRQVQSTELRLEAHSIHAYVIGEHGDSEVVLWSSARAPGGGRERRSDGGGQPRPVGEGAGRTGPVGGDTTARIGVVGHTTT
ncbi:MAG: hypothetical protein ABI910_15925 [Gemmatimonadota bacterium]